MRVQVSEEGHGCKFAEFTYGICSVLTRLFKSNWPSSAAHPVPQNPETLFPNPYTRTTATHPSPSMQSTMSRDGSRSGACS